MDIPLTSMEQLLPFPTAQELVAKNQQTRGVGVAEHDGF